MLTKLKKIIITGFIFLVIAGGGYAANPLVTNVRTADANPLVYNNTFYIVCGQDEVNTNSFNMYAWRLLSSTNMRDWTDHGQILRPDQVSWMPNNRAWASCLVYRNGYFYFYASNDWQIGVLRSTSITGPYNDVNGRPLIDSNTPGHAARDIDPMCYIDDDGQAYLIWGGDGNCRYARLNSDMISLATSVMDVPGLSSYLEAPFVIKENGVYFLMYADSPWPSEIRYATSSSISGPWNYRGVIGTPTGSGTNHEGAAYYKNQWWYTYHTEELSNNNPYSRSVCVDKMYISGDTIQRITYTDNNGGGVDDSTTTAPTPVPTSAPTTVPEVLTPGVTYNLQAEDVNISTGTVESDHTGYTGSGYVNYVNESGGYIEWTVALNSSAQANLVFIFANNGGSSRPCQLSTNGSTAATIDFPDTGDWTTWSSASSTVNLNSGSNTIRLTATGSEGGPNIDRMDITVQSGTVTSAPTSAPTNPPTAAPTNPPQGTRGDANGDGSIDIVDALLIAQCYVGLSSCPSTSIADTNCDGTIDIVDALLIAQYYVGLISQFC